MGSSCSRPHAIQELGRPIHQQERSRRDPSKEKKLEKRPTETLLERAVAANVLTAAERTLIEEAERARSLAIAVDSFPARGAKAKSA